jgi:RES domain-containing protein
MSRIKGHPDYDDLIHRLTPVVGQHQTAGKRTVYRCVDLNQWARPENLITGEGAKIHGSRWMAKDITAVVYAASTDNIALKEAKHNFQRFGIKPLKNKPRLIVEINVSFQNVVALKTLLENLKSPTIDELLDEDWGEVNAQGDEALSQAFGRAFWNLGVEGFTVPSAQDRRGTNLILFPTNQKSGSRLEISGEHELQNWIKH